MLFAIAVCPIAGSHEIGLSCLGQLESGSDQEHVASAPRIIGNELSILGRRHSTIEAAEND